MRQKRDGFCRRMVSRMRKYIGTPARSLAGRRTNVVVYWQNHARARLLHVEVMMPLQIGQTASLNRSNIVNLELVLLLLVSGLQAEG